MFCFYEKKKKLEKKLRNVTESNIHWEHTKNVEAISYDSIRLGSKSKISSKQSNDFMECCCKQRKKNFCKKCDFD